MSISEALGAFDAFARGPIAVAWLLGTVGAGGAWLRAAWRARTTRAPFRSHLPRDPLAAFSVACVLLVLAGCLLTALLSPPNNGDVLGYHLPRVRHWIQNRSFAHYPSNILRQISFPPGASYFVAQVQLLAASDRLASLPQWLALLGCILVTASLARRLVGPRAAVATGLACASLPMAVLQATNAQSDLSAAFWLACFVYLVFTRSRYRPWDVVWLGCALGLGLATKPTVLPFALPFVALVALRAGRRGWRAGVIVPTVVVLLAMLPTLPNTIRNARTFGTPVGAELGIVLGHRDLRVFASNVLRHLALSYPSVALWKGISWTHAHILHLDASDPRTTFPETEFEVRYLPPLLSPDENFVASPVHVTIAIAAATAAVARRGRFRGRGGLRAQLAVALAAGFFLYCGAFAWQPWANRLLLPLLVLSSPLIGWALVEVAAPLRAATSAFLGVVGILLSLTSLRHPLLAPRLNGAGAHRAPSILSRSRDDLYFADFAPGLREQYESLLRQATADGCTRVGLVATELAPEYLLWVTLDRARSPCSSATWRSKTNHDEPGARFRA